MNVNKEFLKYCFSEDIGDGDHSSLSCIPKDATGNAKLLVKENGIIAGVSLALELFKFYDEKLEIKTYKKDGDSVKIGDLVLEVSGSSQSILACERLVLNFMQRMSGIASITNFYVQLVKDYPVKLLDTRKTTPGLREIEKWAVRIGGGHNHRMGLYDMIMLKDNHIDYAGGIENAIQRANDYLKEKQKDLKIEVEVRSFEELKQVLKKGNVHRIMLDNFNPSEIVEALKFIPSTYEVEASGGITKETLVEYAKTGVHYISIGALTHSFKSLDLSLKADLF